MSNPPTGAGASGASPAVTIKEARHMKIPLFYRRADGKDEVKAEDLIDRIEALCKATGKGDDVKIQELYLALRKVAVKWYKYLSVIGVTHRLERGHETIFVQLAI